jgi:tetratricopeptide (TPR) repeat protein
LYEENKLEMALIEFKNAVAINYRYPLVHARMADIYQKLNQPNEAVVALKKEIQKNPRLVKYRVQLAEMLLRYNYLEEAADVLLEALTIEEKNLPLLYLMARVRHEQGIREVKNGLGREKLEAALNYVRLGLSYFPDAAKLFLEKGLIMRDLGDGQQAAEYLQKYLDLDPLALDRMQVLDVMKKL